ncbi:RagB/SusD family nutrient uptake outer membrane protein [Prevotella sp. E2-28]|uniref:RagB/SusD family nutrient uptake outer membrane protein n=1 Tax=Prevotella sp. E2-28 TaxID=2913620 RepID=UPI001ED9E6DA|nr:RagB/SusD family nutrient uptake outer membrane protein [Prevotella sp. E2-28]UKK52954.1 RagB/SusD family nutrient uptake outer membrane protein [Prevotella sp. E2-28]
MKIKNILLTGMAALALTSCNDYLDVEAPSAYTEEFVFSQKTEIERALNGVYAQALVNNLYGNAYQLTFNLNSDVDIQISTSKSHSHNSYSRYDCDDQGGEIYNFWTAAYSLIEYANKFVASAEASELYYEKGTNGNYKLDDNGNKIKDAQLQQWIGEAKCLRAMAYHDLVVMFGDVPFSFDPASAHGTDFVIPIMDREAIQDALIKDLQAIAPTMSSTKDVTVEHCSKEFAQALIARIALTAGGYSLRPNKNDAKNYGTMKRPENWQDFYQIARDYADSVITAGTHSVKKSTYQEVFVRECNYEIVTGDDPIFEIPFAKNSTGNTGYIQGPVYTSNEGTTNGPWGETKGSARLNAFYRYLFRDNDQRREFVNGLWYYTLNPDDQSDSIAIRNDYFLHNNKWSKLWTKESAALGNITTGSTGINYPYMRYADVLLMYAEADNELTSSPSTKAVDCLTQVHSRAFDDGDPAFITAAQADKDAFRKAVLNERKWEFAGENSRWRDLVRTNTLGEELVYSFLRYYSVGMQSVQGTGTGFEDEINLHDGYTTDNGYIDNLPSTIWYHKYQIDEINTIGRRVITNQTLVPNQPNELYGYYCNSAYEFSTMYPNQSLPSLRIYNPYKQRTKPTTGQITNYGFSALNWSSVTFYEWGDQNTGTPKDQCKYSFYGYIRGDDSGNIWIIKNGTPEMFSTILPAEQLPVVRYILPYPNYAVQRSSGAYKNYYGY